MKKNMIDKEDYFKWSQEIKNCNFKYFEGKDITMVIELLISNLSLYIEAYLCRIPEHIQEEVLKEYANTLYTSTRELIEKLKNKRK